jgi:hypothetical protein
MTRIAYIGNFAPARSTENALAYGLRQHGVQIVEIAQDSLTRENPVIWARKIARADYAAVLYTRTHSSTALDRRWTRAWRYLEEHGLATASYHLDVFVGLRRHGMGQPGKWADPLFTTGTVMTPDPALEEQITTGQTRHVWAPPAADMRDSDPDGTPDPELAGKVVFVGSLYGTPSHHGQYPFRAELLGWLQATYRDRFYWYGNNTALGPRRGRDLWDIYASDCVIVGDSCFAATDGGRPYYWSDRIPETLGHGGLLLHPDVAGLAEQHPALSTVQYAPLADGRLAYEIDAALELLAGPGLGGLRHTARADTLERHLYVHRAHQLLVELDLTPEEEACSCPAAAPALPTR